MKKLCDASNCRICNILQKKEKQNKIDRPIAECKNYFSIVTAGAMVKGWILVFPKKHIYSMREQYNDPEFIEFVNSLIKRAEKLFEKKCIIFEHGANHEGSLTACGTNHAHLHIIPYEHSLLDLMYESERDWKHINACDISKETNGKEYWFYSEKVNRIEFAKGYLHIVEQPVSQFFRKLIAKQTGYSDKYNYKQYLFEENAEQTYNIYKGLQHEK